MGADITPTKEAERTRAPDLHIAERVHRLEEARTLALDASLLLQATRFGVDWLAALALVVLGHELVLALGLAGALRLDLALAIATIASVALFERGAYRKLEGPCHVEAVADIVSATTLALVGVLLAGPLLSAGAPPLASLAVDFPVLLVGLLGERRLMGEVAHRLSARRLPPVLVYGAGSTGRLLAQKLLHETSLGLLPVGFVDDAPDLLRDGEVRVGEGEAGVRLPVLGDGRVLEELLDRTRAVAVFIAIPSTSSERIEEIKSRVEGRGFPVYFVPSAGGKPLAALRVTTLGGIPVLGVRRPVRHVAYAATKRALDILGSAALLIAASPALLVAMLLIRWTSRGPAIFSQERVGLDGRAFTIYKLRTMVRDTAAYAYHPETATDARVTPVGRWLRRTSLDELPQLWNVLVGDMSFVGPRPEMPFIAATYNDTQLQRLMVKPGITGLWQVSPDRAFRIHDNIYYDLYYIERRTLALDVAILILTPFLLLEQHAAK